MPWIPLIAAGVAVAGGIATAVIADENAKAAEDRAKKARAAELANAPVGSAVIPTIESQTFTPELYTSAGDYTPEELEALMLGPSAMEGISTDPRLAQAQMRALSSLQERSAGGLNAEDEAALNAVRRRTVNQATAQRASILQNMAQRGMGGAGSELAMQQMASQEAADRSSEEGDRQAAMALQARIAAAQGAGSMGTQMRQQEFGEKSDVAKAKDYVNNFNTQNRQGTQQANVQARNAAAQARLARAQELANSNVNARNSAAGYNKNLIHKQYEDQMAKDALAAGTFYQTNNAAYAAGQTAGNQAAAMGSQIGAGITQAATAGINAASEYTQDATGKWTKNKTPKYDPYTGKPIV